MIAVELFIANKFACSHTIATPAVSFDCLVDCVSFSFVPVDGGGLCIDSSVASSDFCPTDSQEHQNLQVPGWLGCCTVKNRNGGFV